MSAPQSSVVHANILLRASALVYGIVAYLVFLASFLYSVGFIGNFSLPTTIDRGHLSPPILAIGIDLALLSLFAVQHSVMARPSFKRWWTRFIPDSIERSTYVLLSSLLLLLIFWQWRPDPEHGLVCNQSARRNSDYGRLVDGLGRCTHQHLPHQPL